MMTKDDLRELDELEKAELAARTKHRKGSGRLDLAMQYQSEWIQLRDLLRSKLREHGRALIDGAKAIYSRPKPCRWCSDVADQNESLRAEVERLQKVVDRQSETCAIDTRQISRLNTEKAKLRDAIECAIAASSSRIMWESFERVKTGVPQIMDTLAKALEEK
jgi:hypothetical protein